MFHKYQCRGVAECPLRHEAEERHSSHRCADVLLDACKALHEAPAHVMRSISVTCPLCDTSEGVQKTAELGKLLAEEYGLAAEAQPGERSVTVVFLRREGAKGD